MITESFRLFRDLPFMLKIVWGILVVGLILLGVGYFTRTGWQSYGGLGLLIGGYLVALVDLFARKQRRGEASRFQTGLLLSPLLALPLLALVGLLGGIVFLVKSMADGFSASQGLRLLHFAGLMLAFAIVVGIPQISKRVDDEGEASDEAN